MEHCLDGLRHLFSSFLRCLHVTPRGFEGAARLARETAFSVSEIEDLYEMFKRVSSYVVNDGLMNKEEFRLAVFRKHWFEGLFVDRVFELLDTEHNGVLGFEEFIRGLSVFHPRTPIDQKIDFAFKVYDLKQQGFIERRQLKLMGVAPLADKRTTPAYVALEDCVREICEKVWPMLEEILESELAIADDEYAELVRKAILFVECGPREDEKIDREKWRNVFLGHPTLLDNMTFPYVQEVAFSFPTPSFLLSNTSRRHLNWI